jgi:hypothetical protein
MNRKQCIAVAGTIVGICVLFIVIGAVILMYENKVYDDYVGKYDSLINRGLLVREDYLYFLKSGEPMQGYQTGGYIFIIKYNDGSYMIDEHSAVEDLKKFGLGGDFLSHPDELCIYSVYDLKQMAELNGLSPDAISRMPLEFYQTICREQWLNLK